MTADPTPVEIVNVSRPIAAEEWALRSAMSIVEKHCPSMAFAEMSALAADIAEALTTVRRTCNAGLM